MPSQLAVIGTVFVDCKGFPFQTYRPLERNLGAIQFVHGGVGRNVAENLGRLGQNVALVSTVDASGIGSEVVEHLKQCSVNTTYIQAGPKGMGMWLAVLNEAGDLAGSISQMPDLAIMTNLVREHGASIAATFSHLALELDLSEEVTKTILALAAEHGKPVYGIPGNLDIIERYPEVLRGLECFVCNEHEASRLIGISSEDITKEFLLDQIKPLAQLTGLHSMVITMGSGGCVFYDSRTGDCGHQPVCPVNLQDTSGAGDAFFSGTVFGLVNGRPLREAVLIGTKVAGWTIECKANCNPELGEFARQEAWLFAESAVSA